MEILKAIILGIVQGLTEFLPVSSSGHLELAEGLLGIEQAGQSMMMTVVLHLATALSTVVVFRKDIKKIIRDLFTFKNNASTRFSLKIILSMIPAALIGLLYEDNLEALFQGKYIYVGVFLIITGLLLIFADRPRKNVHEVSNSNSFLIGVAQAFALLPGISRSGSTIAAALFLKVDRNKAARFSFLMVVPLILGKVAKDALSGELFRQVDQAPVLIAGFVSAFVVGLFACKWMIQLVKNSQLKWFAVYCFAVGLSAIAISYFRL